MARQQINTTATDDNQKVLLSIMKYLIAPALLIGLIGGLVIAFGPSDAAGAVRITGSLFVATIVAFSVLLVVLMRQRRQYWSELWRKNPSECIGQALGIAIFGSLFAIMFFIAPILLLPYLFQPAISPELNESLRAVFNLTNMLGMIIVTSVISGLTIASLK